SGPRGLEGQELHRVDRGQRVRRHAVLDRIERLVIEEAAPLRVDLVPRAGIGVEVQLPVPTALGDLGDAADLVEDVLPVRLPVAGLGKHAADADDRDLRGAGRGARHLRDRTDGRQRRQTLRSLYGYAVVELLDR